MKKYGLLIIIAMINCIGFSQNLRPTLHQQGKDTLFCFTIEQSKYIAKRIESEMGLQELSKRQDVVIHELDSMILVKDRQIALIKTENRNAQEIYNAQKAISTGLKADNDACGKKVKKLKWQRNVVAIVAGIITCSVLIIK